MTGIGSMAAYLVGGGGYGGLTGPIDQSVLLRERIASNIGLAGEQELMAMAYTQNVVVTLAGNTRFYIVLQEPATTPNRPILRRLREPALGRTSPVQTDKPCRRRRSFENWLR